MSEKIYEKLSDKREILSRFIAIQAVLAEILMNYFPLLSSFVDCKKIKLDVNFNLTTSPWHFIYIRMMIFLDITSCICGFKNIPHLLHTTHFGFSHEFLILN